MSKAANVVRQSLLDSLQCQAEEGGEWLLTIGDTEYSGKFNRRLGRLVFKPTDGKGAARRFSILVEEVVAEPKFFAIAFGKDGFAGDSGFACDFAIPCDLLSTFPDLLKAWIVKQDEDGELENCFGDERPAGFWILQAKGLDVVRSTVRECHNDSAAYAQNRAGKRLVDQLAVKIVQWSHTVANVLEEG